ncbi:glycosyltransferase family 71 protein [Babjeviella inositovora NRRL Y-12698]|uniref:Glycosyltransferase family 71 protein n=1 Tax=Babjeviella inositovora NRRL Y-12698 TaxID=984486 RepID=A0A1E3QRF7_9ASCO|nr:glycosyltransferase family 71 protein [Babjeviella inositovora NRRL Y-12698]ODQ80074.1 glycosyltransferase family 71 protein [Babjeviella inositovora NRRL Y-12698]
MHLPQWNPKANQRLPGHNGGRITLYLSKMPFNRYFRRAQKRVLLKLGLLMFCILQIKWLYSRFTPISKNPVIFEAGVNDDSPTTFKNLLVTSMDPQTKRETCQRYFQDLYVQDPQWAFQTFNMYDPRAIDHDRFIREDVAALQKAYYKDINKLTDFEMWNAPHNVYPEPWKNIRLSDKEHQDIESNFKTQFHLMTGTEQGIVDTVANLRAFGACHLLHNQEFNAQKDAQVALTKAVKQNKKLAKAGKPLVDVSSLNTTCEALQERLFPWMTSKFPVFTRWDGKVVTGRLPVMSDYLKDQAQKVRTSKKANRVENSSCYILRLLQSFNGKGIVISAADKFKDDLINLIRVLRSLQNELPIQVFHSGDLSLETQREVVAAARATFDMDSFPKSYHSMVEALKKQHKVPSFPQQEIWFADVRGCVVPEYEMYFKRFYSKLLPHVFGSFEETMLMDADTVPLVPPADFFQSRGYLKTETLFFKDRETHNENADHTRAFFRKMMPTVLDELFLGLPAATNFTLDNAFLGNNKRHVHLMESGIVMYRKSAHFTGILMTACINFWTLVRTRIGGDKEMFWLGMSMAADENYSFNGNHAAAVGTVTPKEFLPAAANEICSTQPGHVSSDDDQTLMWINSGFKFCKKPGSFEESKKSDKLLMFSGAKSLTEREGYNENAVRSMYSEAIDIQAAIVPPETRKPLRDPANAHEPPLGWKSEGSCNAYLWCAYDRVGASSKPEHQGKLIEFSADHKARFKFIGDLWMGYGIQQEGVPIRGRKNVIRA